MLEHVYGAEGDEEEEGLEDAEEGAAGDWGEEAELASANAASGPGSASSSPGSELAVAYAEDGTIEPPRPCNGPGTLQNSVSVRLFQGRVPPYSIYCYDVAWM